jgi:hypothetical protein
MVQVGAFRHEGDEMNRITFRTTRKRLVKQMTLTWAIPMTLLLWALMWHYGALSPPVVVLIPLLALIAGFGFATAMATAFNSRGDFKDEE